jgi:hypothetical protein
MSLAPEFGDPDELAESGDSGLVIVPAPTKPYEIAQMFMQEHYSDPRGQLLLHHRGLFYTWAGTHWPEVEGRTVRSQLYGWLGDALYRRW